MQFLFLIAAASAANAWPFGHQANCLSERGTADIIHTFTQALLTPQNSFDTYVSLVQSIVNSDYQEISDSVNFFTGVPVGSVTVGSFADLVSSHRPQGGPAYFEVDTLNIWHSCNVITWRYKAIPTKGAVPVQSLMALVIGNNGKIDTVYYEFNDAIWAQDLGYNIIPPTTRN